MSSKSPNIEIFSVFKFLAACNPNTKVSYSSMSLVVSNSYLYYNEMTSLVGEIRTTPTPKLSFEHEPSKNIF